MLFETLIGLTLVLKFLLILYYCPAYDPTQPKLGLRLIWLKKTFLREIGSKKKEKPKNEVFSWVVPFFTSNFKAIFFHKIKP